MDLDYLFWETMPEDTFYITASPVGSCFQTIKFERDGNYNIICELQGDLPPKKWTQRRVGSSIIPAL